MSFTLVGPVSQTARVDSEGNREYKVTYRCETDSPGSDGPQQALDCAGLPTSGAPYLLRNDSDIWAWCREDSSATPEKTGEPSRNYLVEKTFSTKPPEQNQSRCNTTKIEDPLLEPFKISGNFSKYTEEAAFDRFGQQITYSSFEPIRGRAVEFDNNRPTVKIEQNVANLNWPLCASLVDCVNAFPMWGLAPRCVKLTNVSWERKFWGLCSIYYTRILELEVDYRTWDRNVVDESHLCLRGHWNSRGNYVLELINGALPNPLNPGHYDAYQDLKGNPKRGMLNGFGLPAGTCIQYPQSLGGGTVFTGFLMSITDVHTPNDLNNPAAWVRLTGDPRAAPFWIATAPRRNYPYGSLVRYFGNFADQANGAPPTFYLQGNPNGSTETPNTSPDWMDLGIDVAEHFQGEYNVAFGSSYLTTDSVFANITESPTVVGTGSQNSGMCFPTGFGTRHIEKYQGADLFILGVPASF